MDAFPNLEDYIFSDPYWEFEPSLHFKPKVQRSEFYKLSGQEFCQLLLIPLEKMMEGQENALARSMTLSWGQKALYFWSIVDSDVTNGGFVQLYYNRYGAYVPTAIKGLRYIGDESTVKLLEQAVEIYIRNKEFMDEAMNDDLLYSETYEQLDDFDPLEDQYYAINEKTRRLLEEYIRKHPTEFCFDEEGKEIDRHFKGECTSYYPEGALKENFGVTEGRIHGIYKCYYENKKLKEHVSYAKGRPTGEKEEYYESGILKYKATYDTSNEQIEHQWYHENGKPKKLEHKTREGKSTGEYSEWYENGQLKELGTYSSTYERTGPWLQYYEDGSKKEEAEYKDGKFIVHNYWNEQGEQLLKDGTGLYFRQLYHSFNDVGEHWETQYRNYKHHGVQKTYVKGVLIFYTEYEDGELHGYSREYYNSSKPKEESIYSKGKCLSRRFFPKSDNPKEKVTFKFSQMNDLIAEKGLPLPDEEAFCLNEEEIKQRLRFPYMLWREEYINQEIDASTCLGLLVDEEGEVKGVDFYSAYMTGGDELREVADQMRFTPARKNGHPAATYVYIIAKFEIV